MQYPKCLAFIIIPLLVATLSAQEPLSRLDTILERGYLRVGTTGDFKPFTYFNPESKKFEGIDIDAAESMGQALGVEVRYVKTTWSTLSDGILEDRYDIAVGGITRTLKRQALVGITDPYFEVGKCPLVRTEDQARLNTIQALNNASVRGRRQPRRHQRSLRPSIPHARHSDRRPRQPSHSRQSPQRRIRRHDD